MGGPTRAATKLRRAAAAVLLRTAAVIAAAAIAAPPAIAVAQVDPYRQHMENGIKLFHDGNYTGAIVEFEAAYKERPKASPLFNVALAEKALFNYPKAIAALERALAQHLGTMDESDQSTARSAIEEMRALLAHLTVELSPPDVTLIVDGNEQPRSAEATRTLDLGPGVHRIEARADGYSSAEQSISLASGERDKKVKLSLVPDKGTVTIDAGGAETAISIDSKFVAFGRFTGMLAPGTHVVQIYEPDRVIYAAQVLVVAGRAHEVRPGFGGVPFGIGSPIPVPPPPPPARKSTSPTSPRRGYFVIGAASLLWPLSDPKGFSDLHPQSNSGGAGTLRIGYRVNVAASFDVMLQYANVEIDSSLETRPNYTLSSGRFGVNLRLMSPGQRVRFVGSLGGGLVYDDVTFNSAGLTSCGLCKDASGPDPFLHTDVGLEIDLSGVLLGFSLDSFFQSSRGIEDADGTSIYEPDPLMHLGGSVHVGYAFW